MWAVAWRHGWPGKGTTSDSDVLLLMRGRQPDQTFPNHPSLGACSWSVLKGLSRIPITPEFSFVFQKCAYYLSRLYPLRIWRRIFTLFQLNHLQLLFVPSGRSH